ncbi:protease pro-enzyme activation domain-containing protein [Lactobacillus sp. Sy-1]|uniref:S53 family peptidase n=1 Tax=Lactobacillus sp. Sy-1 TaxID=2109645 RepID=UPI001C560F27|nr:S53 family peptidase [Lactobacillus sp. Sy-1]MBW1605741.1 S8/S53 family peptidase [Lactobacillus sp. Sy-1]
MINIKKERSKIFKSIVKVGVGITIAATMVTVTTDQIVNAASTKKTVTAVKATKAQTVNLILKPRATSQLSNYIEQTVTPGNANYRKYLTPKQFAAKYGQTNGTVSTISKYFKKYKIKTSAYSGNVVLKLTGQTKNIEKAFNVKLNNVKVTGDSYQKANRTPKLPQRINSKVLGIFGLNNNTYTNPGKSLSARLSKEQSDINTYQGAPQKFMDTYNAGALYKDNHVGTGQTIGIISFAKFKPSDATKFWKSEGIPAKANRIKTYQIGSSSYSGEDETAMDVEQAGAVAPKANINVYVSNPSASGMINSLSTAVAQNKVSTLSISWGQSENQVKNQIKKGMLPANYNQIVNLLFQQAAAQGISIFASTGDNGAYDGMGENRYPQLTVDTPANSPYVTAVGGTTLPRNYTINGKSYSVTTERAWSSDFLYPKFDNQPSLSPSKNPVGWVNSYFAGSGGGFSTLNAVPSYQAGFSGVGTFRASKIWEYGGGYLNRLNNAQTVTGTATGRNLPDVSANADPNTGYSSYHNGKWYVTGGTSVVAPQIAGMAAVINSAQGKRMGFWNPQIYRFAKASDSPFTPLNSATNNNNLYYTGQPGKLYNQATGLGTINFGKLNTAFSDQK